MTPSLISTNNIPESHIELLAKVSQIKVNEVNDFFSCFEIDTKFPAYQNLIESLPIILTQHAQYDLFDALKIYKKQLAFIKLFNDSTLDKVVSQRKDGNPVRYLSNKKIAALILMRRDPNNERLNTTNILSTLIALATLSPKEISSTNINDIKNAAQIVRQIYESKETGNPYSHFEKKLGKNQSYKYLCSEIKVESKSSSNLKSKRAFEAINKILPLINRELINERKSTKQKSYIDVDMPSDQDTMQAITFSVNDKSEDNDMDEEYLLVTDNQLDDYNNTKIGDIPDEIIDGMDSNIINGFILELKDTRNSAIQQQRNTKPIVYLDRDYLKHPTSLFNPIERHWLTNAILHPEEFDSDHKTALIVALSICTGIEYRDIQNLSIGGDGDITPSGLYKRKIPVAKNAIKPEKGKKYLYKNHISYLKGDASIYLPLPNIVTTKVADVTNKALGKTKIKHLFNDSLSANHQVKSFIGAINTQYGQRFITNRISCQLKQYVKSKKNDPCLSFVLFGHQQQRAPSAYYYRSMELDQIIQTYKELSSGYFK